MEATIKSSISDNSKEQLLSLCLEHNISYLEIRYSPDGSRFAFVVKDLYFIREEVYKFFSLASKILPRPSCIVDYDNIPAFVEKNYNGGREIIRA